MSSRRPPGGSVAAVSNLPEYIINNFMPSLSPLVDQNPAAFRMLSVVLAMWYFGPIAKLQSLWAQLQKFLVSCINVSSEEDLFDYLLTYLAECKTLRADQSLNASSNAPRERMRMPFRDPPEESNKRATAQNEAPKLKYEHTEGTQLFFHGRRLFWAVRKKGEGSTFTGRGYRNVEILSISCLGRSTEPIKHLLQSIFETNKDRERASTIIRRPFNGGYGGRLAWSRITSKPRRALETVILDKDQKSMVLDDIEEYMDEATSQFYGAHGIPYRRGYLFFGPPGVGKTSFALAIANKFNLDVYVLTLLDQNLTDSDLISLLNQLPGRSLLLLEDIDVTFSRKSKTTTMPAMPSFPQMPGGGRRGRNGPPKSSSAAQKTDASAAAIDDDDDSSDLTSKVSLSGLLNAIDGVAAPEGHILVMTTNRPQDLDDALVRAGRISVRVKFDNASREQAKEIFRRMYIDLPAATSISTSTATAINKGEHEKEASAASEAATAVESADPAKPSAHVQALSEKFADTLPEHEFSPADLQDYLLIHKKDPAQAMAGLDAWVVKTREQLREREEEREKERAVKVEKKKREEDGWKERLRGFMRDEGEGEAKDGETAMEKKMRKMMNGVGKGELDIADMMKAVEETRGGREGAGGLTTTDKEEETKVDDEESGDERKVPEDSKEGSKEAASA